MNVRLLLSFGLASAGLLLLLRLSLLGAQVDLTQDGDMLLLIAALGMASLATILIMIKEAVRVVQNQTHHHMRVHVLAEHQRFLRRLDHEVKNPLTALRAGLGSLTLTLYEQQQRDIVQTLADEALRLSQLINDLRKLAQLETAPLEVQTVNLNTFFREIAEFTTLGSRDFTLILPPNVRDLPALICDPDLLLLALHNLIDNAVKYSRPSDRITLEVKPEREPVLSISVVDTGIGIPEADRAHIWEDLYRGSNTGGIPGNGIGLALVKAIVERHYGEVGLTSALGQGTRVTLWLPFG